jgi:hypothetical protein
MCELLGRADAAVRLMHNYCLTIRKLDVRITVGVANINGELASRCGKGCKLWFEDHRTGKR